MTTSDGSVGATVKVVDHGPNGLRWNLVILGDGYRAGELGTYHADVQNFLNTLVATPPFDELWCGINVHRVDVTSTDSGADDPTACAGGSPVPGRATTRPSCSPPGGAHEGADRRPRARAARPDRGRR